MPGFNLKGYQPIVRLFEKQVEWLGLSRNAGPILAAIFISNYRDGRKLNAEQIAEATSYSRSNVGLIISQLEALGIIYGEIDFSQTGRGRRRILYSVEKGSSLASLAIRKTADRLEESIREIDNLLVLFNSDVPEMTKMLKKFKKEAEMCSESLSNLYNNEISR
jgi:DNA-binding transcriptional regulator GbsR (MarR family)